MNDGAHCAPRSLAYAEIGAAVIVESVAECVMGVTARCSESSGAWHAAVTVIAVVAEIVAVSVSVAAVAED